MKRFIYNYWLRKSMDVDVYAETKEEAEQKLVDMETGGKLETDKLEFRDSGFDPVSEEDVDPDEDIPVDCVERRFKGDILITDPCYIKQLLPVPEREKGFWDYFISHPFDKFEADRPGLFLYGLYNTLIGRTIYGDWSCTTYMKYKDGDIDIGRFCADAGLVGVFLLEEVERFNSNFSRWLIRHQHCGMVISGFNGVVKAVTTRRLADKPEHDIPLLTHTVHLEGAGTCDGGDFFEFYTKQTGY